MKKLTKNEMRDMKLAQLEEDIDTLKQKLNRLECGLEMNGLNIRINLK